MKLYLNKKICLSMVIVLCTITVKATTPHLKDSLDYNAFTKALYFCDMCGCSGNGGSMGYGNTMNSNFFGVRYIHQRYNSRDGIFNNSPWVDDEFNTMQLWSSIPIGKKITVNAMFPYQFHRRVFKDKPTQNIKGIGDVSILAFYELYTTDIQKNWMNSLSMVTHTIRIGGGVKIPTGAYNNSNAENKVNPSFQVGTGSWDYIFATDYSVKYKGLGATVTLNYTLKSKNDEQYKFGDQLNYSLAIFKTINTSKQFSLTPFVGLAGEIYKSNEQYGQTVVNTEGKILFSKFGVEATLAKFSLGLNAMLPISQNLNNGFVRANYRMGMYLNYNL